MTANTSIATHQDFHPAAAELRAHDAALQTRELLAAHEARIGRVMGWLEAARWLLEHGVRG